MSASVTFLCVKMNLMYVSESFVLENYFIRTIWYQLLAKILKNKVFAKLARNFCNEKSNFGCENSHPKFKYFLKLCISF